jgi:CO/xanthine dehydrogenase FAD-binding subunit
VGLPLGCGLGTPDPLVSARGDGNNRREEREGDVEDVGLQHIQSIARPTTADEAWRLRTADPEATRFLGGGIDLILYTPETVTTLIDVSRLGHAGVTARRNALAIGAGTTLSAILEAPEIAGYAGGFLAAVLRHVASPLQRNVATIGGAVARAHPWSDVVLALLVLDADVEVFDGAARSIPTVDFYSSRSQSVAPLVTGIRLPMRTPSTRGAFEKFARTGFDVGLLNCACVVELAKGVCRGVRIAVGGTPSLARRLPVAEESLEGKRLSSETIGNAATVAARGVDARDDRRASESYRRTLTEVGVRRCLERLADGGGEAAR